MALSSVVTIIVFVFIMVLAFIFIFGGEKSKSSKMGHKSIYSLKSKSIPNKKYHAVLKNGCEGDNIEDWLFYGDGDLIDNILLCEMLFDMVFDNDGYYDDIIIDDTDYYVDGEIIEEVDVESVMVDIPNLSACGDIIVDEDNVVNHQEDFSVRIDEPERSYNSGCGSNCLGCGSDDSGCDCD